MRLDRAERSYLDEVNQAFEQCCRQVIVDLDDDLCFDELLSGPLAKDLDAYDRGKITSSVYVRRICDKVISSDVANLKKRLQVSIWSALDTSSAVLRYLNNCKQWDGSKKEENIPLLFELLAC